MASASTARASHFARRYGCRLPIVIALFIFSNVHFSYVIEPVSEKGESPLTTNYFWQFGTFFPRHNPPCTWNRRKPSCKGPFLENRNHYLFSDVIVDTILLMGSSRCIRDCSGNHYQFSDVIINTILLMRSSRCIRDCPRNHYLFSDVIVNNNITDAF